MKNTKWIGLVLIATLCFSAGITNPAYAGGRHRGHHRGHSRHYSNDSGWETAGAIIAGAVGVAILADALSGPDYRYQTVTSTYVCPPATTVVYTQPSRVWVPAHYEQVPQQFWVEGSYRQEWVPATYDWVWTDSGRQYVKMTEGYYRTVWVPGYYETRYVSMWVQGYWR